MAAPAEPRTPNLHRAKIAPRECEWKHGDSGHSAGENLGLRKKIHLTPTGLLMEGDYTQNARARNVTRGSFGEIAIFQQLLGFLSRHAVISGVETSIAHQLVNEFHF